MLRHDGLAVRLGARSQQGPGRPARDIVEDLGRPGSPGLGLGVEDVGADREPGDDAPGRREPPAAQHRNPEAVRHARRVVEGVAGEARDHRQQGDREEASDPGHGVVDAGGDARVACVGSREHRGRDRRDDEGQPGGEDEDRRQYGRDVGVPRVDLGHQQEAHGDHQRPDREWDPRTDSLSQGTGAGREGEHHRGDRQGRRPGLDRRVAHRDLEEGDHEEEEPAKRCVHDERDEVRGAELARAEDVQRQHRVRASFLGDDERRERGHTDDAGERDHRRHPAWTLDQGIGGPGKAQRRERGTATVEPSSDVGVERLRHVPGRGHAHEDAQREVDQEDRPPGHGVDEVSAQERADGRRHATEPGPRADGPRPISRPEARLDHRQASGSQQRAAHPLDQPSGDQEAGAGRHGAEERGHGEEHHADDEYPASPVPVPERAPEQDHRGERQQVAVEDPLQRRRGGMEVTADVRQRDVDHRAVQERHPGAEHGDRQNPSPRLALVGHPLFGHVYRLS